MNDENSRNFSKQVENAEGKGEIAHYAQFLLFPQFFFLKDLHCRHVKTKACLGKALMILFAQEVLCIMVALKV